MPQQNSERIIYLADDDEDDRILFLEAVEDLNMPVSVELALDGKELINALTNSERLPEIIFLDINMPCKNGFECLKEIRSKKGALQKVKIVILSTSSSSLHITLAYKLGADFYAVKPGSIQGLRDLLKKVLDYEWKNEKRDMKKFLLT
ncbi:response regulator [Flavobacterium sp. ACN6]|uniref:response regulator n=1 Tax=Flavobacterium sp. ACN6 TaxID=1920426 RepID=UPI000BB3B382|nr:response regulator [Flavobacterium sp. ACN6]PBJ10149.1 Transcriptional regulatory protein WalR [Flavobacterium sp. ACN6]